MKSIAGLILCGGESRRMGQAKAWLPFGPERMLQRVARIVATVAEPVVVVAAPDQDLPALPGSITIVRDPVAFHGPLQGLASGLGALGDGPDLVYLTGTDFPFLEPRWPLRLAELIGEADIAIPRVDGFHHPLSALYRRTTVLPAALALLAAGRMRPVFLLETLRPREVVAEELRAVDPALGTLRNLNTPDAYAQALADAGFGA